MGRKDTYNIAQKNCPIATARQIVNDILVLSPLITFLYK